MPPSTTLPVFWIERDLAGGVNKLTDLDRLFIGADGFWGVDGADDFFVHREVLLWIYWENLYQDFYRAQRSGSVVLASSAADMLD